MNVRASRLIAETLVTEFDADLPRLSGAVPSGGSATLVTTVGGTLVEGTIRMTVGARSFGTRFAHERVATFYLLVTA